MVTGKVQSEITTKVEILGWDHKWGRRSGMRVRVHGSESVVRPGDVLKVTSHLNYELEPS